MKLYDVSLPIHPRMIQWAGEDICAEEPMHRTPGDEANVTRLTPDDAYGHARRSASAFRA